MLPCGVRWEQHKVEDDTSQVLAEFFEPNQLPPKNNPRHHTNASDPKVFLTSDLVDKLNILTREEQEFFGYAPFIPP